MRKKDGSFTVSGFATDLPVCVGLDPPPKGEANGGAVVGNGNLKGHPARLPCTDNREGHATEQTVHLKVNDEF